MKKTDKYQEAVKLRNQISSKIKELEALGIMNNPDADMILDMLDDCTLSNIPTKYLQ